jgi:hypothetical protein
LLLLAAKRSVALDKKKCLKCDEVYCDTLKQCPSCDHAGWARPELPEGEGQDGAVVQIEKAISFREAGGAIQACIFLGAGGIGLGVAMFLWSILPAGEYPVILVGLPGFAITWGYIALWNAFQITRETSKALLFWINLLVFLLSCYWIYTSLSGFFPE